MKTLTALIDADVLRYEIGFCGEYKELNEETGEEEFKVREFDFVAELLDGRVKGIIADVADYFDIDQSDIKPVLYLTGSETSTKIINRSKRFLDEPLLLLAPPIRESIAVTKPYKGTRAGTKPFHYENLTAYIIGTYEFRVSNGLEADDLICMDQFSALGDNDTIICTRDKDLRMCPGWHYGWECGKQPSFGPTLVDNRGQITLTPKGIKGTGLKFFFSQMLTGDTVDNIPGCAKIGPAKAFAILEGCNTRRDHERAVIEAYKQAYGDKYKDMLEEQSKLLWMIRELNEDGSPVHYEWKFDAD